MKIGIEIEFFILKRNHALDPVEANPESSLSSLVALIDDFDHLYANMKAHGINMEIAHKECGGGQFEVVLNYGDVMKTLDDYYLAKEIITQHFRKKGCLVTFIPKPFENECGNGAHVHISLWKDG
jgi:glutamine synthetase